MEAQGLRENSAMISRRSFAQLLSIGALSAAAPAFAASKTRVAARRDVIRPRRLAPGDTVGLVLPASGELQRDDIAFAREQLEAIGLKVVLGRHVYDRHGYLAGRDEDRATDINRLFADKSVNGIVCYTGGWGTPRLLPYLDYALIRKNPKVLLGFSDITALLIAIHQETGLVTFHGPVGSSTFEPYTLENLRKVVMTAEPAGLLTQPPKKESELVGRANRIIKLAPGRATGRLVGGNLTLISATMGTPYEIDSDGAILFLEDIREDLYRVDRMLTQLALSGKLQRVAGVVFGRCTDCGFKGPTFSLEDLLRERFGSLGVPAISGLSFGHIEKKLTLPIGVRATLDGDAGTLSIDEAAVT